MSYTEKNAPHSMMSKTDITLSVVVPAYNEAENLVAVIREALACMPPCVDDFELIVIDDGSTDATAAILEEASAAHGKIKTITHMKNRGKGAALQSGFHESTMEWILFTDADRQIGFAELAGFLKEVGRFNIVVGFRKGRSDSFLRQFSSGVYALLVRMLFNVRLKDINCPFKLFPRKLIQTLDLRSSGFFIDTEIISLAQAEGHAIGEIGVSSASRQHGVSSIRLRHVYETLVELFALLGRLRAAHQGNER